MSELDSINVVIKATDEASSVIEKVNSSLDELSGSSLEHANKSLKTFRDEMGKAEKNVKAQKENVISNQKALRSASVTLREKKEAVKAVAKEYKSNTAELKTNGAAMKLEAETISSTIAKNKEKISALQSSNKALKKNSNEYKENAAQIKKVRSENTELTSRKKALTASIKENNTALENETKRYKAAQTEVKEAAEEYRNQSKAVEKSKKAVAEAETTYGKFAQKLPEVEAAQKKIDQVMSAEKMAKTGQSLKTVGGAIDDVTKPLQIAAVGTVAMGIAAGKAAMDYETAFTGVRKTVDGTEEQLAALNKGLLNMSETTPVAAKDLANFAAVGGQLGVGIENIGKFTKVIADMNVATNLTGEEGAAILAQFMNVMGENIDNVDRVGSSIVDLGNTSATTERDIAEMAQRMGSFARSVGIGTPQVLGYAAALASMGVEAQAGGSAVGRTWASIQKAVSGGGESLEAFAKYAGVSAEEFKQQWNTDASGAFNGLIKGLSQAEDLTAALAEVGINNTLDVTAIQLLAKGYDLMTDCLNRSSTAYKENTALTNEANAAYNTTANKLQLARNAAVNAGIEWGNVFLPEVQKGAEWIGKAGKALGDMSEGQKQAALTAGKLAIATGATSKLYASGIKNVGSYIEGIARLKKAVAAGGTEGKLASLTLGMGKLGLAVGAVGVAVYGAKKAYDVWYDSQYNWSRGLSEGNERISESLNKYKQLSTIQQEIKGLKLVIENPESSKEQVEQAKTRLNEIREMLSKEYNLVIKSDNSDLDGTVEKIKAISKNETDTKINTQMSRLADLQSRYESYAQDRTEAEEKYNKAIEKQKRASELKLAISKEISRYQKGEIKTYDELQEQVANVAKTLGYSESDILKLRAQSLTGPGNMAERWFKEASKDVKNYDEKIRALTASYEEYKAISTEIANWSTELIGMGAQQGDSQMVEENLKRMSELIKSAGLDMAGYAQKAALAMNGVDSLNTAWEQGGATLDGVVNDYIRAMTEFGASAQDTAVGAALIKNGFNSIADAAAAGKLDVISQQATELAQQLGLIPDNKSISISASGDISILEMAEDKIQSIQNENITVSVNADGDVEVLDKAGNQVQYLEGIGAVSLQVNADGNIDVLNDAGEKIAEIPKEVNTDTEINVNANTDSAKSAINDLNSERVTVTADADVTDADAKIKGLSQTVNITLNYKATGAVPKSNAKGTQNFSGGLAMVNDERGIADPRELIIDQGRAFIAHGRDVILPLSKGAKVYTAYQTRQMMLAMGIPHYAKGKDNSEAFTAAKDDWTHYTKTHAVSISEELAKWVEFSEKFKSNQKDVEDIQEQIYSLVVKQNDEMNNASEKWTEKRIFNNDWEDFGDDIYSAYDRIKTRNMELVTQGKMLWDDYAEYMENVGENMYDNRREQSENWLEHERKYNNLSNTDYKAGLQRMKDYTIQMYNQGIINHEKMREEMQELDEKYFDFVKEENQDIYSGWQNDADMWEKMRDTYDDWDVYNDSRLAFIDAKLQKTAEFLNNGVIGFKEADIAMKDLQMDRYNEISRIYDEQMEKYNDKISEMQEKFQKAEQEMQSVWAVEDRAADMDDLKSQISVYEKSVTQSGKDKLKDLKEQLKKAEREQALYELQQKNNAVIESMQETYKKLENNKVDMMRNLKENTLDMDKVQRAISAYVGDIKAAAERRETDSLLRQILNAVQTAAAQPRNSGSTNTYNDSRKISISTAVSGTLLDRYINGRSAGLAGVIYNGRVR